MIKKDLLHCHMVHQLIKASNSKYGDLSSLNKQSTLQRPVENVYDFDDNNSSSNVEEWQEATPVLSQEEIENNRRQEVERIRRLREEATHYKTDVHSSDDKKEIQNNYVMYVNNEKVYPIRSKDAYKTTLSLSLHKSDEIKIYNNDELLNIDGYGSKYVVSDNAKYKFIISNNNSIKIEREEIECTVNSSKENSKINKEVDELLNSIDDWDKI